MKALHKKIYMLAGYNTISMGTGRKEFHPKKERPGMEHYLKEAGQASLNMIGGATNVDEGVVGNFMAARFIKQANLPAFFPMIDEGLKYIPAVRVEGACASGGLALTTGIKSILAGSADVVLAIGFEVQNTMKAMYGADVLAGAGWQQTRKKGHAYYFPGVFSDRAGVYYEKFGRERTRKAMARWYCNAIENARLCETAQEYHNQNNDLEGTANTPLNPKKFVDHLNVFDCSKVSDGASSIVIVSEEGLRKIGSEAKDAVEVIGFAHAVADITQKPENMTSLTTLKTAVKKAMAMAEITIDQLGTIEVHDCFSIAGILALEAIGFADEGKGAEFVLAGHTARNGSIPVNTTGGLIGWGHPTGATGIHQAVTIWEQLTGRAGKAQIKISKEKPYALSVNMGGDDRSLVAIVYKSGE
ncbi:beta-ketoacyl synthase N-terminal-like domain-containing protein [Labilibaculum sp.]|uniref:thiolase C-terminal domain-containing protein n=1 Tax=Labilibaculum sp. TaxID=2060723 RepID=UPI0035613B32